MFTDATVQRLWDAGRILAAYEASREPVPVSPEHPFRDQHLLVAEAQQWHEHGVLCWYNARDAQARAALDRAHEMRRKLLGPEHPDTLDTQERIAAATPSIEAFETVIGRLIAVLGEPHLRVAIARRNLAAALRDAGKPEAARSTLQLAAPVIESALPAGHPDVVALLKVDALLCVIEKNFEGAIERASRAIEIGQGLWNESHPFIASAELTIVNAEYALAKYKRARQRLPSICWRLEVGFGEHPILALALWRGAGIALAGRYGLQEAELDLRRAIEIFRAAGHPATGVEVSLFENLFYSGRTIEAGEYAESIFDSAARAAKYVIATRLERAFRRAAWKDQAQVWAQRAFDASLDDETRAEWAERVAGAGNGDTGDT